MKKNIKTLAALLIASATFVACSSDNDIIGENQQPVNPTGKYTMTINVSKGDGATTRALTLDETTSPHKLNASWATTENVYVQKGETWAEGSLQPQEAGTTTTLKGTLSGIDIVANDELTLQFPKSGAISYAGQVGTLADIQANFDWATASVEVESVSPNGNINPKAATTTFTNQQAIIKFTLKDKANDAAISPSALTVTDGTSTVELTSIPAATYTANGATNVLFIAFPAAGSAKTVTLTATVSGDTYTFTQPSATFVNGQYYEITVKMTKVKPAAKATAGDKGKLICTDGHIHAYGADAACTKARVAKIIYIGTTGHATYTHGLALALADEGQMNWESAKTACNTTKNTSTPVTGATWLLASKDQWDYMMGANGAGSDTALRDGFTSVGGTNLQSYFYWSSTEYGSSGSSNVWDYVFSSRIWSYSSKDKDYPYVRACLAF